MFRILIAILLLTCPGFALISKQAILVADRGSSYLSPLLSEEDKKIYKGDNDYILQFPFREYKKVRVQGQGYFFIDNINDTIKNFLRSGWIWEKDNQLLIKKYVKPGTNALDIGSHIGTHTVTMSAAVGPNGTVFAFEPNRKIYRELCMNLTLNKCQNVIPIRCAIGKSEGVVQVIESHPNNEGGSYVIEDCGGHNKAAMKPLDDFSLTNISFIKIDVENMEADVLDGAFATICSNKPIILIEIQGNGERAVQLKEDTESKKREAIEKILALGYRLEQIKQTADYLAFPN